MNFNYDGQTVLFSRSYNDTVFQISPDLNVEPILEFDFGKFEVTQNVLKGNYKTIRELSTTIVKNNLVYRFGNNFRNLSNVFFSSFKHNRNLHHLFVSKTTGKVYCFNSYINDLEGETIPRKLNSDLQPLSADGNSMLFLIEPRLIIEKINNLKETVEDSSWKETLDNSNELIEIYQSLKETDNPIIAIYELEDF